MEITTSCPKCSKDEQLNYSCMFKVKIDEHFFTGKTVICNNDHEVYFISKDHRYQFLFQQAIESYNLGFYIECFNALHSGLDAFKKEFVATFLFNESKNIDNVLHCVKMLKRSEMINGAFVTSCFSLSDGEPLVNLPTKKIHFRNTVIHEGVIPSKNDCEETGNLIFDIVAKANNILWKRYDKQIDFHQIMQTYQNALTAYKLEEKGYSTHIKAPEVYHNRDYIDFSINLNVLSASSVMKENEIDGCLFTKTAKNKSFILTTFHASA